MKGDYMKVKLFRVVISFILLLAISGSLLLVPVVAAAEPSFSVVVPESVDSGKSFKIAVQLNGNEPLATSGIKLRLTYDSEKLTCIPQSHYSTVAGMTGCVMNVKDGETTLVWGSSESVTLRPGNILLFTFSAKGNATITLHIDELYDAKMQTVPVGALNAGTVILGNASVQSVMDAINGIGKVENTVASKEKINSAWDQYCTLSSADKLLVTNYETLVAAMKEYERLQQEQGNSAALEEAAKFREDHAYALSLTLLNASTVKDEDGKLKDVVAIQNALDAMGSLSAQAQMQLSSNRNTMKEVYDLLEKLAKDEIDKMNAAEAEKNAIAQAEVDVAAFREGNASWVLALTEETVTTTQESGILMIMEDLKTLEQASKYHANLLAGDKAHITKLLLKIEQLKALLPPEKSPEELAAEDFKDSFSYVLSLTPETVVRDDMVDINIAAYAYSLLNSNVQAYLIPEGELINSLMDALNALPEVETPQPGDQPTVPPATEHPEPSVPGSAQDNVQYRVNIQSRAMSKIVWILLIAVAVLSVIFGALYGLYNRAKKKSK